MGPYTRSRQRHKIPSMLLWPKIARRGERALAYTSAIKTWLSDLGLSRPASHPPQSCAGQARVSTVASSNTSAYLQLAAYRQGTGSFSRKPGMTAHIEAHRSERRLPLWQTAIGSFETCTGSKCYHKDSVFRFLAERCEENKDLKLILVACKPRTE